MLKPGGKLILETAVMRSWKTSKLEKLPLLFCPVEDESPYEPTSVTFFNTKGMVDSLKTLNFKTEKVSYLYDDLEKQKMSPKKRIIHSLSFAWKKYFIDRGTFICTATDNDHEGVSNYWNKVYSAEDIANMRTPKK